MTEREKRPVEEKKTVVDQEKPVAEKKKGEGGSGKGKGFWKSFFLYYGLLLALYLYFMLANLSMAPKFVYTQF